MLEPENVLPPQLWLDQLLLLLPCTLHTRPTTAIQCGIAAAITDINPVSSTP